MHKDWKEVGGGSVRAYSSLLPRGTLIGILKTENPALMVPIVSYNW